MSNNKQRTSLQVDLGKNRLNDWLAKQLKLSQNAPAVEGTSGATTTTGTQGGSTVEGTSGTTTTGTQGGSTVEGTSGTTTSTSTATADEKPKEYRVVEGDTLQSLADRFKITVDDITNLEQNQWYFQLVPKSVGTLTPNTVIMLPAKAEGVPDLAKPVYDNEPTGDITSSETEEVKPLLEAPVGGIRTDIKIWTPLTPKQQEDYKWTEVKEEFLKTNADVKSPNELDAWIRKNLRDGWSGGKEAAPSLMETRVLPAKDGDKGPVFEAYSFSKAWKGAVDFPLQKNVGAYFYWQHKLSDKKGLYQLEYSSNEQWLNLQNNKDNPKQVDYDLLAKVAGAPTDLDLVAKIRKIASWNDQLLSEEFLLLTSHAQAVLYKGKNDPKKPVNGVYTADTFADLTAFKKADDDATAATAAKEKALLSTGVPDDPTGKTSDMYTYKRDGVQYRVHHNKLVELEDKANKEYGTETLEQYVTENFPPAEDNTKNCFAVLSEWSRQGILRAYNQEWWLNEEQEKIVNLLIKMTPAAQRTVLNNWLKTSTGQSTTLYKEFKTDINDSSETKRSFFDVTENLVPVTPGQKPVVDTDYINEIMNDIDNKMFFTVPEKVDAMSEKQIQSLSKPQFIKMFNGCYSAYQASGSEIKGVDHLVSVWGKANPSWIAFYITVNDLDWHYKIFSMLDQEPMETLRDDLFESVFSSNTSLLTPVQQIALDHTKTSRNWEAIFAATPKSVFSKLAEKEQMQIIKDLTNGAHTDDNDEKTIIRVMHSIVGTPVYSQTEINDKTISESEKKRREDANAEGVLLAKKRFYDKLKIWDPDMDRLLGAFQGYNETLMVQAVNSLNVSPSGIDEQKQSVNKADDWDKDDAIDSLAPEVIQSLDYATRISYIRILLGRTPKEDFFNKLPGFPYRPEDYTMVGRSDEESLLALINTCHPDDIPQMLHFLQANNGDFYSSLQYAIDGDQFKQLHQNLAALSDTYNNMEKIRDPKTGNMVTNPDYISPEAEAKLKQDMTEQGVNHPNVVPWQDPGLLSKIFTNADSKQYGAKWSGDNAITITYIDSNFWESASIGGASSAADLMKYTHPKTFRPWELIGVKFLEDDSTLGAFKGEIRFMPAIYIFFLKNKQFHQELNEAIQVAALALGCWELAGVMAAAEMSFGALAMAIADIVLPAGELFMSSFKDKLPPEVREAWEDLNTAVMAYQFLHGGAEAYTAIKGKITKLLAKTSLLGADEAKIVENIAQEANGKVKLGETIDNATTAQQLEDFEAALKAKGAKLTDVERQNIMLKLEERKAILAKDDDLLAKIKKQQEATKQSNKIAPKEIPNTIKSEGAKSGQTSLTTLTKNTETGGVTLHVQIRDETGNIISEATVEGKVVDGELKYTMKEPPNAEIPEDISNVLKKDLVHDNALLQLSEEQQALLKEKPVVKGKTTPVKVKPNEPVLPKEKGEISEMLAFAKAKNVVTVTGKDAERMIEEMGVNAMYVPGVGGNPGILVIGPNASKADVFEEMLHMKQHEALGWKKMTKGEIIQGEIDAQTEMIAYAKENNLPPERITEYEDTQKIWQEQKDKLKAGDVLADMPDAFFSLMKQSTAERKAAMVYKRGMSEEEFLVAARKNIKNGNYSVFEDKLKMLYNDMNKWPEGEVGEIQSYFNAHPESDLSAYDLKAELNDGKHFDASTGEFKYEGEKTPTVKAAKEKVNLSSDEQTAFDLKRKASEDQLKADAELRKQKLDEANNATDEATRNKLRQEAKVISQKAGDNAAKEYMESLGAKPLFVQDVSAPYEVDQIWELNGEYYVIEAKGGTSGLGVKRLTSGEKMGEYAQQGTKEYLQQTLQEMVDAKGLGAKAAQDVLDSMKGQEKVNYLMVRQGFDAKGVPLKPEVNRFIIP